MKALAAGAAALGIWLAQGSVPVVTSAPTSLAHTSLLASEELNDVIQQY